MTLKPPVRIAVTGAAGQIAYATLFRIAGGIMLGRDQPVILQLLDLPRNIKSGLKDAREKLRDVEGLYFHTFTSEDVVRHPLVQKIVEAYEAAEEQAEKKSGE